MKNKSTLCLLTAFTFFVASAISAEAIESYSGPYGYSSPYAYGYGISSDNPISRSVDNHYDAQAPVNGYAQGPRGRADYNDPYHAEMEAKARELNLKKMDRALKNEDRMDRADGRREARDRMYTGREGLGTLDKTTNTIHNVHSLIRSFR